MSVYRYKVTLGREDFTEEGTVIAKDEYEAKDKLRSLDFRQVQLKKLNGLTAFVKQFLADVK
ncbi:MAG: hypothetical protein QGD90_06420 [Candidatus Hydrogenedentes bacterium]|nr:hypothetical protein [Candidatus Hydrogenedentota bacterium]MDK1021254.1 hypothetical protein [Candidatus Hydrogenedentota bacterium]